MSIFIHYNVKFLGKEKKHVKQAPNFLISKSVCV
jgi:hypothetical protein